MTDVYMLGRQLSDCRAKLDTALDTVDLTHSKLVKETAGTSDYMCRKLKALYEDTIWNSELEENLLCAMAMAVNKTLGNLAQQAAGHVQVGSKSQSSAINSLDSSLPVWPGLCVLSSLLHFFLTSF